MDLLGTPTCHTESVFQTYNPIHPTGSSPGCHGSDRKSSTQAHARHELALFYLPRKASYLIQLIGLLGSLSVRPPLEER